MLIKKLILVFATLGTAYVACGKKEGPTRSAQFNNASRINTAGWEDSPYVTEDDQTLYMMYTPWNFFPIFSGGIPVKLGPDRPGHVSNPNPWDDSNLYVSTRDAEGKWTTPKHIDLPGGKGGCCAMVSRDGKSLYYGGTNSVGPKEKMDVYVSTQNAAGAWSMPQNLGAPVNTEHKEDNPHLSWDGNALYFTSDRPGSVGGKDIYVSHRKGDTWGEPVKLSTDAAVNEGDEDQVWVSKDQNLVYFGREKTRLPRYIEKVNGVWSSPKELRLEGDDSIGEISFSQDLQNAYFAVIDFAGKDIILSVSRRKSDGSYGKPEPLD